MALSLFSLILIFLCGLKTEAMEPDFLKVPSPQFLNSLQATIDLVRIANSTLNSVASNSKEHHGDLRLTTAVSGCIDMLDLSYDVLGWSTSVTMNPNGVKIGTGDRSSDLQTWLGATRALLETCMDELDIRGVRINGMVHLKDTLTKGTSGVQDLFGKVRSPFRRTAWMPRKKTKFPSWVSQEDKRLLKSINFPETKPNTVVATDGTGNFRTIMEAVAAAPEYNMQRYVIFVKAGTYREYVEIPKKKWNIMLVGEGSGRTTVTGNKNGRDGVKTFKTATVGVNGMRFIACNMTIENTAGPYKGQAVALRSDSDLSVYYRCSINGFQDTLYPHSMRQFYRDCQISGTIDFIFGRSTAMFQNCNILVRKGRKSQRTFTITANGRAAPDLSGFSFQSCRINAHSELLPYLNTTGTYLGRPWKNCSRTVFMQSYMSDTIRPKGWMPWNGRERLDCVFYAEYRNRGPGSGTANRVKWPGYHVITNKALAKEFTVAEFIQGHLWLPATGIVFQPGLG